jgi:hypothetical protein
LDKAIIFLPRLELSSLSRGRVMLVIRDQHERGCQLFIPWTVQTSTSNTTYIDPRSFSLSQCAERTESDGFVKTCDGEFSLVSPRQQSWFNLVGNSMLARIQ